MTLLISASPTLGLRANLMGSTGLTPTFHKGGGGIFKAVLGIAAAVAIAFVAPYIAAAIGFSGGFAGVAASAVIGGGLGAASSFALGGNPLVGAIGGGIGGGIGGFNFNPGVGVDSAMTTSMGVSDAVGGAPADFSAAGGYGYGLTSTPVDTSYGGPLFGGAESAGAASVGGYAGFDLGATLSSNVGGAPLGLDATGSVTGTTPGLDTNYQMMETPDAANPQQMGGAFAADPNYASVNGGYMADNPTLYNYNAGGTGSVASQAGAGELTPKPGLWERTQNAFTPRAASNAGTTLSGTESSSPSFWGGVKETASSPRFLTQAGLQIGGNLAANMLVGSPDMSDYEKGLLSRQDEATARMNAQSEAANKFKSGQAEQLKQQAAYYDPNYTGAQDYATSLNRRKRQEFDALAGVDPSAQQQRAGLKRRYDLDTARSSTAAFDTGYGRGVNEQTRLTAQAAAVYPNADTSYSNTLSNSARGADAYYQRMKKEQENASELFSGIGKDLTAGGLAGA